MTAPEWMAPSALKDLQFSDSVLSRLRRHRQKRPWQCEAGGQLFGRVEGNIWRLEEATGPRRGDLRTLFGYEPDRVAEQREIDEHFARGLHFLGDWHTHRERSPEPSPRDIRSMGDMIRESRTDLPCFLMVIVGVQLELNTWHISHHGRFEWSRIA